MQDWQRVTRDNPCPICKRHDWCTYQADVVCCMRMESGRQMRNGGWAHRIGEAQAGRRMPIQQRIRPLIDAGRIWRPWINTTTTHDYQRLSDCLHIPSYGMATYGAAWSADQRAWAFPMLDGQGWPVGIRLRSEQGRKWAVRGSRQGLFCPLTVGPHGDTAVIVEGPTDAIAAFQMGFWAIGRPSCLGCHNEITQTLNRWRIRRAIIIADNDRPGITGASKLADELKVWKKIVRTPAKDIRAWRAAGATPDDIRAIIDAHKWRKE